MGGFISAKPNHFGVRCRLKAVSRAMLLSLPITAKYFRRLTITFGYTAERWFKPELVGADIPCWPNYYSLLCCHIRLSSDNGLESASVIRWLRWTLAGSVKLTIKECVMNRMIRKWLPNVCISLCDEGFLPVTSTLNFSWWEVDYFWQALAKLSYLVLFYYLDVARVLCWV